MHSYKERLLGIKSIIEESNLNDEIINIINKHYDKNSVPSGAIGEGRRTVYKAGKIQALEGELYIALKLYPTKVGPAESKIEWELALFEYFNELGLPVPSFSAMAISDDKYGTVTQDLTHNGKYELKEFDPGDKKFKQLEKEWFKLFFEEGFAEVPFTSLFVQIEKEKNEGKPIFADLEHLTLSSFSDSTLPSRIMT